MNEAYIGTTIRSLVPESITVDARPCVLHTFSIGAEVVEPITITDGTTTLAAFPAGTAAQTFTYDIVCKTNLVVTVGDGIECLVSHKPLTI